MHQTHLTGLNKYVLQARHTQMHMHTMSFLELFFLGYCFLLFFYYIISLLSPSFAIVVGVDTDVIVLQTLVICHRHYLHLTFQVLCVEIVFRYNSSISYLYLLLQISISLHTKTFSPDTDFDT